MAASSETAQMLWMSYGRLLQQAPTDIGRFYGSTQWNGRLLQATCDIARLLLFTLRALSTEVKMLICIACCRLDLACWMQSWKCSRITATPRGRGPGTSSSCKGGGGQVGLLLYCRQCEHAVWAKKETKPMNCCKIYYSSCPKLMTVKTFNYRPVFC